MCGMEGAAWRNEIQAAKHLQSLGTSGAGRHLPRHCPWNLSVEPLVLWGFCLSAFLLLLPVNQQIPSHSLKPDSWSLP